ncbi:sigma-70 family RNA polymerase sigma factor [Sphingomonas sp. VDB2]|uniref:sigma-70 family RNA polymerase sigma factor n=1 Tax=Sphingomonas sp. VDB2 TaxID=3228751 RepID=UPI003A80D340
MDDARDMEADLLAMRRYARALARDESDADDVVQDALLRAIERRATYQPERSRTRWLLAIVHNVFVSAKRRQAAETRRNDRFAQTLLSSIDPQQEEHVRLAEIAQGFAALPEPQRAVLHLTAIEGLSYQQAADILGVPIGTVMSRLSRARAALRDGQSGSGRPHLRLVGGHDDQ